MFISALIAGLSVGLFRGGSLNKLSKIPLKFISLVVIAIIIQVFINISSRWFAIPSVISYLLILFSYLILASVLFLNRKDLFIKIILVGVLLNFLVIAVNGGMPISTKSAEIFNSKRTLRKTLAQNKQNGYQKIIISDKTDLNFLGEVVPLPLPYSSPLLYSLGDILICLGLFVFLQSHLIYHGKRASNSSKFYNTYR